MILCLDVGNSQIYGGLYNNDEIIFRFRKVTNTRNSSDEIGLFLRTILRENGYAPSLVTQIGICSVVPQVSHHLRNACLKYFERQPFIVGPGSKTGLKIKYANSLEVGPDRIANAIAAKEIYPRTNMIIVDFGTATTFCAISKGKEYLGGVIIAGLRISMDALESKTARLPSVEIVKKEKTLGRSTSESIQSGLYYGHLGSVKEIIKNLKKESFKGEDCLIIGTGGFASLYQKEGFFDKVEPDLVLKGIYQSIKMNL